MSCWNFYTLYQTPAKSSIIIIILCQSIQHQNLYWTVSELHIKQKMSKVMKKMLVSAVQNMVSVSELHENVF